MAYQSRYLTKLGATNIHVIPCCTPTWALIRQSEGRMERLPVVMWLAYTDKDGTFNVAGITTHDMEQGNGTINADPGFSGYVFK